MSNKITWKFIDLPSVFTTDADKLDLTVNLLRQRNYLSYDHEIEILSNGNTESNSDNTATSSISSNTKKRKSVSKPVEDATPVEETPVMQPLSSDVDLTDPESDVL